MAERRKLYWDSSLFICFLNRSEDARRTICEDVLQHASRGEIVIYTSIWTIVEVVRPNKHSLPSARKLTPQQIVKIQQMFEWKWLKKISVDQVVANKAVELERDYDLRAGDAVHAASAILQKVDALQRWDRDYDKVKHLISIESPTMLTVQGELIDVKLRLGPAPDDFTP